MDELLDGLGPNVFDFERYLSQEFLDTASESPQTLDKGKISFNGLHRKKKKAQKIN